MGQEEDKNVDYLKRLNVRFSAPLLPGHVSAQPTTIPFHSTRASVMSLMWIQEEKERYFNNFPSQGMRLKRDEEMFGSFFIQSLGRLFTHSACLSPSALSRALREFPVQDPSSSSSLNGSD